MRVKLAHCLVPFLAPCLAPVNRGASEVVANVCTKIFRVGNRGFVLEVSMHIVIPTFIDR